jgi:hypothetical protein
MSRCENTGICSFFQNAKQGAWPEALAEMKDRYCKRDKEGCARYHVKRKIFQGYSLPGDNALDLIGKYLMDLGPEDHDRARQLISLMVR